MCRLTSLRAAVLAGLLSFWATSTTANDLWLTDLDQAQLLAAKDRKDLFILFTGTSWCHPCVQFEESVLNRPEFVRIATPFVLVKLEYPHSDDDLPPRQKNALTAWRERYGIRAFPTVLLADATGRPYAVTGHAGLGIEAFGKHVRKLQQNRDRRDMALSESVTAIGIEKAKDLDAALSAIENPSKSSNNEQQEDMLARFYRPEIDRIIELDPANALGLRAKYLRILGADADRRHIAETRAQVAAVMKEGRLEAALQLIDGELRRAQSEESRKKLKSTRLTYLEWEEKYEDALAYATQLSQDPSYSQEENRRIRTRVAFNLNKLGRIAEMEAVYDRLISEVAGDHPATWRYLRDKANRLTAANCLIKALDAWESSRRYVIAGTDNWLDTELFRARLLSRLGRHTESIAVCDRASELDGLTMLNRAIILAEKAMILRNAGQRDAAVACSKDCEKLLTSVESVGEGKHVTTYIRRRLRVARGENAAQENSPEVRDR